MKQTDGSSPETLATSLSFFDVNDHESHDGEREKKWYRLEWKNSGKMQSRSRASIQGREAKKLGNELFED